MPKRAAGLTARKVETIRKAGMFADGNGLYLQVTATGAKSWIFRYALAGRRRDMGLGAVAVLPLAEAREKAIEAKKQVSAGIDPIDARRDAAADAEIAAAKATTFKQAAEAYQDAKRPGWKNAKHSDQWSSTLESHVYPTIGALPVGKIDTALVLKVLEPIWGTVPETASRIRGRIEAVLDYAKVRGARSGENPARWRGHLANVLPARGDVAKTKHHAALPYQAMPAFWPRLQLHDGMAARALELAILTATRTVEVIGATWSEINLDRALWTIPAERMKAGVEHKIPLSDPAVALLRKLNAIKTGDAVLAGGSTGGHLSNQAMLMVTRRMKIDAVPHGFRSTFRTWAAEQTAFAEAVAEACLAHAVSDAVIEAYRRSDFFEKRRKLIAAWAGFLESGTAGGKVVTMRHAL
ncbi:tyrosine-type recombinase/integrase [Dongia sp.]|uniref:tyrosine-type recombinase/integrase n=1 Tax=Dongia sp. TaxID=1977262 RepID=UPI00375107DD